MKLIEIETKSQSRPVTSKTKRFQHWNSYLQFSEISYKIVVTIK